MKESQRGVPYLNWGLRVLAGQCANRLIFKAQRLTAEGLPYLRADLELLQIRPDRLDMPEHEL